MVELQLRQAQRFEQRIGEDLAILGVVAASGRVPLEHAHDRSSSASDVGQMQARGSRGTIGVMDYRTLRARLLALVLAHPGARGPYNLRRAARRYRTTIERVGEALADLSVRGYLLVGQRAGDVVPLAIL